MNIPALVAARIAALVFAAAALLSACTVDVEQPRAEPPYGPQSGYCTREYAPVCARRGGDRQTFNNGCLAEEAGYRILRSGECRNRGDDYGDGGGDYGDGGDNYGGGGGGGVASTRHVPRISTRSAPGAATTSAPSSMTAAPRKPASR